RCYNRRVGRGPSARAHASITSPMTPSIIVHGGAGAASDRRERVVPGCENAAQAGWKVLSQGGSALDAVEAAIRVLEDDGEFNAGYGASLNRMGIVEVDASIMDGK